MVPHCVPHVILDAQHLSFTGNRANTNGGAIHIEYSNLSLGLRSSIDGNERIIHFENNLAEDGGGIYNIDSVVKNYVEVIFSGIQQREEVVVFTEKIMIPKRWYCVALHLLITKLWSVVEEDTLHTTGTLISRTCMH